MRSHFPRLLGLIFILLIAQACGTGQALPEKDPVPPSSMFVEAIAPFCDNNAADKFTLGYFGAKPLDTTLYFYIVCHQNDTVYRDHWPAKWMLDSEKLGNDSLAIAELHQNMHRLVEGKMGFQPDSSASTAPAGQKEFSFELKGHLQRRLYFSKDQHKAVEI